MVDLKKICSVCKKKPIKYAVMKSHCVPTEIHYGFCSKTCIANHTIKYYKMKEV